MIDHTFSSGASIRLEEETENTPAELKGGRWELVIDKSRPEDFLIFRM